MGAEGYKTLKIYFSIGLPSNVMVLFPAETTEGQVFCPGAELFAFTNREDVLENSGPTESTSCLITARQMRMFIKY